MRHPWAPRRPSDTHTTVGQRKASKSRQKIQSKSRAQAEHQTRVGSRIDHQPSPTPAATTINPAQPKPTSLELVCATPTHRPVSLRSMICFLQFSCSSSNTTSNTTINPAKISKRDASTMLSIYAWANVGRPSSSRPHGNQHRWSHARDGRWRGSRQPMRLTKRVPK